MRDTPMGWAIGCPPMGDARLWEMHAYERHACKILHAYERCTPVRDTPMGWPIGEARI
jgi:hypothetical protein